METLSVEQAYLAMYIFLDGQNRMCSNEISVGEVLDNCGMLNGEPVDAAMWSDWLEAVEKARDDKNWGIAQFKLFKK